MYQRKNIRRGWNGRYLGFRINCEQVPILPAWAVGRFLADPRKIPYLLVWESSRDGTVKDAVRLSREAGRVAPFAWTGWIEVKRTDGTCTYIRTVERPLPRNNGKDQLLLCPSCHTPRRTLYGAKVGDDGRFYVARRADWECRTCCTLRYSSEGGALLIRGGLVSRLLGQPFPDVPSPRPDLWLPNIFSSPRDAEADGLCIVGNRRRLRLSAMIRYRVELPRQ